MFFPHISPGRTGAVLALVILGWLPPNLGLAQTQTQLQMQARPEASTRPGPQTFGTQERRQRAVMDLDCGNKTYRLDTGNDTGSCGAYTNEAGVVVVTCTDGTEILVEANCTGGCVQASGTGSCTINP
ncbi:MAG: hypothetical protein AAGI09_13950 [Pseudomonadota bacterium]